MARTVQLPLGKQEERLQQVKDFLEPGAYFSYKDALVLAGHLNHVTYIIHFLWTWDTLREAMGAIQTPARPPEPRHWEPHCLA
jgi:hypothetical protein